jgi:cell division protein FtsB
VLRHAHGLAAAGLLLIQLVMSVSTIWIDRAMAERESIVAAEVAQLELDRDRLTIAVAQAGDPAAIEVRARDSLFYVRPEDHLVIIPGAALADEIASPPWWLYE